MIKLQAALGDRVKAGQVLATLDSPDLAQAYDDYDKAAAELARAQARLRVLHAPVDRNIAPATWL